LLFAGGRRPQEFAMLFRAAVIAGLLAALGGPVFAEDSTTKCVDASAPKAVIEAHHGRWIILDTNQWQFLRGVYAMNPETPPGLPYGDHAALARFEGREDGIVFFIDGDKVCTPMLAPSQLLSMMADVGAKTIRHDAAGL
jgi:hypothetical protein